MKWIKNQGMMLLTLAILIGGGLVTWGRMQQVCNQIEQKADKETVQANREAMIRELNEIQKQLVAINVRMDGVIIRQAIIQPSQ